MRKLAQLGFLILVMLQLVSAALGQGQANIAGLLLASNFTGWSVGQGNNGNYNWTSNTFCRVSAGGLTFNAFTVGVPVYLADTSAPNTSEVVVPTAVTINNSGCSIRINPANQHQTFYFRTATAGLGEAVGFANNQNFEIVLTPQWTQLGGLTSMITSSIGNANVSILDQRNSVIVPYVWSGSAYVAQPFGGGGGCGGGCVTSVNALGSGPISGAVVFQGAGSTVINQVGQTITISSTGTGGGPLGTLPFDLPVNNIGGTNAVDTDNFYATSGYTPQQAATAAIANNGILTIMPSAGRLPFVNAGNNRAIDMRSDVPATAIGITEKGAVCDLRSVYGTLTSGSKTVTIVDGFSALFSAGDIGRILVAVGSAGGIPTAFETAIASITDAHHALATTNAPFTQSTAHQMDLGHDDSTAITNTMNQVGGGGTLVFPEGACFTHAQTLRGQSPIGLGPSSAVIGFPGENVFQAPDPSQTTGVNQGLAHIHDLTGYVDERIDATLPWQIINDSGTTSKPALYQPIGQVTASSNNPRAPGWFRGSGPNFSGAYNGVANVQAGSANITIPTGVTLPLATQQIVFPYLLSVFTATVSSVNTGTRVATLNAAMPSGSTNAQAEWFVGASAQNLATSIGSGSCPATITLSNSINPVTGFESNVAPFGLIQIDGEQFSYFGKSNANNPTPANTLYGIQCAQNGTARAAHSTSATVVPLNPFKPAYPWPVTPTINGTAPTGDTTPTGTAGYYPAWNVGNAFFSFPVQTGISTGSAVGSWNTNSRIENLTWFPWPSDINGQSWQEVNHSAGLYWAQPPYGTVFSNIMSQFLFYGIVGGPPAIENGNWAFTQPTADTTHWDGIQIWAAVPMVIPYGNQNTFSNLGAYSNEQTTAGAQLGADVCYYFTALYDDQTGGGVEFNSLQQHKNEYCEPETGPHAGKMTGWEWDAINSTILDQHMGGGTEVAVGGSNQHWIGGNFNQNSTMPLIDYGTANTSDYVQILGGATKSNVYGTGSLIEFGNGANWNGQTANVFGSSSGPYGPLQAGNSRVPCPAQTMETFSGGNLTAPYTSSACGLITPEQFNTSTSFETQPMNVGWTFDDSSPITHAYAACNVGNNPATTYCNPHMFNQQPLMIGPDQTLVAGKYRVTISARDVATSTNTVTMIFGVSSGCTLTGGNVTSNIPIKNTWPTNAAGYFTTTVDLTGAAAGCSLNININGATTADQVQIGLIAFVPLPEQFAVGGLNLLGMLQLNGTTGSTGQVPTVQPSGQMGWGSAAGITSLTGDALATGTGSVASQVVAIGGGSLNFTGLLQLTAGVASQATQVNVSGSIQAGTSLAAGIDTVTASATPVFNGVNGNTHNLSLTQNATSSSFTAGPGGSLHFFKICQDTTGGRTFVWPTNFSGFPSVTLTASGAGQNCTTAIGSYDTASGIMWGDQYNAAQCINGAASNVPCGSSTRGYFAVPAGTNSTLAILTSAVGSDSGFAIAPDGSVSSLLGVSCSAASTPPYKVTARTPGTGFTFETFGTTTNPECFSWSLINR